MNNNLEKKKEEEKSTDEAGDSHRLTINRAAENVLVRAVERVNDGYQGGKVNRNQVAVWAIQRFGENLADDEIKEIRAEYLDEFSAFEAVLRRAKDSGKLPIELKTFIQKQMGLEEPLKKKSKKGLQNNIINDDVSTSGD
ncbi:MAG: hypothetical protein K2Q26_03570 [Bdellovibrionales bacterium]|nr:hypothetical protein [Bdellovibrionales bacterium]